MKTAVILFCFFILSSNSSTAQNRYALLIGINQYEAKSTTPVDFTSSRKSDLSKWSNLDGCVNDVLAFTQIINSRYGFTKQNIRTLLNEEATNQSIKDEIIKLKKRVNLGDIVLFYYSGHGSQVINSLSYDGTGKDQTIVPSDLYDIRNKELSKLFNEILDKIGDKGKLTLIFDSCHSGGVARGNPTVQEPKSRNMPPVDFDFKDPSEFPKPEDRGALVFSAAQRDQPAKETNDENGNARGAFSYALLRALAMAPITESAERLFMRVNILLKVSNRNQDPILGSNEIRKKQGIFGDLVENLTGKTVIPVEKVIDADEIRLQGGLELSLYPGAILNKMNTKDSLLIKIIESKEIGKSVGKVLKGNYRNLSAGDLLEVTKFSVPDKPNLIVKIPQSNFTLEEIMEQTKPFVNLTKNGFYVSITDPIKDVPNVVIQYNQNQWQFNQAGSLKWEVLPNLSTETLKKKIPKNSKVLLQLPASKKLTEQLKFGPDTENSAIEIAKTYSNVDYTLIGIVNDTIKYAWVKTDLIGSNTKAITPPHTNFFSQYSSVSDSLIQFALRLGRINAWVNLASPPQEEYTFPYILALKNRDTGKVFTVTDNVYDRDRMTLVLKTDSISLRNWDKHKRFCYVFVIDMKGKTTLLYPRNLGSEALPLKSSPFPMEEPLNVNFKISSPFGLDTYFLLTTEIPINDTSIFEADGVLTRSANEQDNPLSKLLRNVGSRTRGQEIETPSNWSIQKLMLNSLPKIQ